MKNIKKLCYLKDVKTYDEMVQWVAKNKIFASKVTNIVYEISYFDKELDEVHFADVNINVNIIRNSYEIVKVLRDDIKGYEVYKAALPEYFV